MSKRILVVDDSRTVCKVVEWVFHGSDFEVISAGTAAEAKRIAVANPPDVMLIDYVLPDENGLKLCLQFSRSPKTSSIPLVILAGTYHPFDQANVSKVGATGFIMKPFNTDEMIERVNAAISAPRSRRGRATGRQPGGQASRRSPVRSQAPRPASPPVRPTPSERPQPSRRGGFRRFGNKRKEEPTTPDVSKSPDRQQTSVIYSAPETQQGPSYVTSASSVPSASSSVTTSASSSVTTSASSSVTTSASSVTSDPEIIRQVVKELLPNIVRDTLADLLRKQLGERIESYSRNKIDKFVASELEPLAQQAISEYLANLG